MVASKKSSGLLWVLPALVAGGALAWIVLGSQADPAGDRGAQLGGQLRDGALDGGGPGAPRPPGDLGPPAGAHDPALAAQRVAVFDPRGIPQKRLPPHAALAAITLRGRSDGAVVPQPRRAEPGPMHPGLPGDLVIDRVAEVVPLRFERQEDLAKLRAATLELMPDPGDGTFGPLIVFEPAARHIGLEIEQRDSYWYVYDPQARADGLR